MVETKIIAFAGKGGVGKTSLAALTVRLITEAHPDAKVLAIDADPAIGLSTALGIDVTHTVDHIRKQFIDEFEGGEKRSAVEILDEAHYRLTDTIVETEKFAFMAIGRPEGAGCYCKVNAFLKDIIGGLADDFDYVVIDGEAGIEQVNRRVMEKVSHLILVTDASRKGIDVIHTIKNVADDLVMAQKTGAIVNRVRSQAVKELVNTGNIEVVGWLPEEENLAMLDIEGRSLMELAGSTPALAELEKALVKMEIL